MAAPKKFSDLSRIASRENPYYIEVVSDQYGNFFQVDGVPLKNLPGEFYPAPGTNHVLLTPEFISWWENTNPIIKQSHFRIYEDDVIDDQEAAKERNREILDFSAAYYLRCVELEEERRAQPNSASRLATEEDLLGPVGSEESSDDTIDILTPARTENGHFNAQTSGDSVSDHEDSDSTISPTMVSNLVQGYLPSLPEGWKGDSDDNPDFKVLGQLSPPVMRKIEPYGPHFLAYARRKRHGRTFSEDERMQAQSKVKNIENEDLGEISEPEDPLMLARDAKDWKGQDHYAVLGLSKYRYKATDAQIKAATRKKVLRHHPDKKAAARAKTGDDTDDSDSFFKCIQRANEILTDPVKRRQFDSVDEAADVPPPTKKDIIKPSQFYKKWNAFFESEGRFSKKTPVPRIGDDKSTKEEVEEFYDFWYNFDSWRTFEYLDEDVPDDNEGRDHKRHIEKKNSNARRKHKSEDIARLRKQVDECLAMDERIKKFRKAGRADKDKKRLEKEAAAKKEAEEKQKAKEEEEARKKVEDEAAKVEREQGKKAKEATKNAVKKNKRTLKASVKDVNYFNQGGEASAKQVDDVLDDTDLLIAKVDPDELAALAAKLSLAGKDGGKVKDAFVVEAGRLVGAGKVKAGGFKVFK